MRGIRHARIFVCERLWPRFRHSSLGHERIETVYCVKSWDMLSSSLTHIFTERILIQPVIRDPFLSRFRNFNCIIYQEHVGILSTCKINFEGLLNTLQIDAPRVLFVRGPDQLNNGHPRHRVWSSHGAPRSGVPLFANVISPSRKPVQPMVKGGQMMTGRCEAAAQL